MTLPRVEIMGVHPIHPGRGEPSRIEAAIVLRHLRAEPVVTVILTPAKAIELIEQLAIAIRVTDPSR